MLIRTAKRAAIAVMGVTVVLIGLTLIVLPGPAFVVIPAGLAILATEFAWAKWMLKRAREQTSSVFHAVFGRTRWGQAPDPRQASPAASEPIDAGRGPISPVKSAPAEQGGV